MKHLVLSVGLFICLSLMLVSCNNQSSTSSIEEQQAQALFVATSEYLHEFNALDALTKSRLWEADNEMRAGNLDTKELWDRTFEIFFAEATTIEFLDNLPEYSPLHAVMWEDGKPPKLIWDPDNFTYQQDFKQQHAEALRKTAAYILTLESELGIKLQYSPVWHKETTTDNKTQENK